jgi:hypothetical protein
MAMMRVVTAFLALLLFASVAHAETAVCPQRNLLTELQQTDPAKAESVLKELAATPNADSLFWKIEAPNKAKPSWLIGTAHVTDPRVTDIKPEIKELIAKASTLVLELKEIANKPGMARAIARRTKLISMPEGQSLWDVIPDDKEAAIRTHPYLAPGQEELLAAHQPWVVAVMLSTPPCERNRAMVGVPTLDEKLALHAQIASVPIVGLETLDEQLGAMAGMAIEDQAEQLIATAALGADAEAYFQTVVELYLARQVAAYVPLVKLTLPQAMSESFLRSFVYFENTLIEKRNRVMAERARAFVNKGNAFIAVGALHLPGETGVVELLREAGYKVMKAE